MHRCGRVALVGKPNVGKSTLLNRIVGQKLSIVSSKPQTTRRQIVGIATAEAYQIVFVDTPGIHAPHTRLDRAMLDAARGALDSVDLVVVVVDAGHHPGDLDKEVAKSVRASGAPTLLCMNKMDRLEAANVAAFVEAYSALFGATEYMLTTATRGTNVDRLVRLIVERLPEGPALYSDDEVTDQSSRFLAGEFVREQLLVAARDEVPYATAVQVESWDESGPTLRIEASILVEKASQRGIVIGKRGAFLKRIGQAARSEIEKLLGRPVYLGLHVRVAENWRMNPVVLHELEYGEPRA